MHGDVYEGDAIAMGKKDNAIFLDTATLEYEYAPIHLENAKIVIACSNKKRGLGFCRRNDRLSATSDSLGFKESIQTIRMF